MTIYIIEVIKIILCTFYLLYEVGPPFLYQYKKHAWY